MDNHHVQIAGSQISCGIGQLYSLTSDPEKILYALANHLYHPARGTPYAAVIWSDTDESNGVKLYEYLRTFMPHVQRLPWVENPKTSNDICLYYWELPHTQLKEWYIKERIKKANKL